MKIAIAGWFPAVDRVSSAAFARHFNTQVKNKPNFDFFFFFGKNTEKSLTFKWFFSPYGHKKIMLAPHT